VVVGKADTIAGDHGGADLPRPDRHLLIFGQVAAIVLPEDEIRPIRLEGVPRLFS